MGIPPQRQQEIHSALSGMPNVTVEFADPGAAPAPRESAAPATVSAQPPNPRIEARLEQQLGGRAVLDRFTSQMLDGSEAAMSHAYALRGLAERFSSGQEAALAAGDRSLLHGMAREHLAVLATETGQMESVLQPVLVGLGGTLPAAPPAKALAAEWQPAVMELFSASRSVEVLISQLLGVTTAGRASPDLPSQLLAALRDLRTALDHSQKLLAQ
jgi:hypothetical protein